MPKRVRSLPDSNTTNRRVSTVTTAMAVPKKLVRASGVL